MTLSIAQMKTLSVLLDEVLPMDKEARRAWLDALPPEHADIAPLLREALLQDQPNAAPQTPLILPKQTLPSPADAGPITGLEPGARVGPYELIRPLGAGGMAEVWLAKRADGVFKREVALKLPAMTRVRKDLEQRFARERDILAGLEHPHIARLYDAGIDSGGLPYLSMEFVQGEQLTDWCDAQRLDLRRRLSLFLQVLEAVQYAHDRHVIHRDLKPSNILVTHEGQARLLDFGVATLLESGSGDSQLPLTILYGHAMTPTYSSPEMVRGEPADAKSDIYSLGVVLFELLTGGRPYQLKAGASRAVLELAVAAAEVRKPSTQVVEDAWTARATTKEQLVRQLRGDLDLIVLKALDKDPQARYSGASALADDLQRHLDGNPVMAQPPRPLYRLVKFVRRNQMEVSVIAAAALLVMAVAAYEIQRRAADRARALTSAANSVYVRKPISERSIAVLPFVDMSENKDQRYFSDGLSEELISLLAQVNDLEVIARTSSFHYRGTQVPVAQIGSALGVAHLLDGSVRRVGNTIRVAAQLIRAQDGVHLWSQTFERDVKDIFQVQDEIAAAVVAALKLKLLPALSPDPNRSDDPEAYNQFLLARQFGRRGNAEDLERAVTAYRKAIALDSNFAAAYAGLSFSETSLALPTQDAAKFAQARDDAEKALELAPQLVDAYRARALYRLETLDFAGARADSEQALNLAPGNSAVQSLYGIQIAAYGKIPQAIKAMNKAIELDPLSGYAWANVGLFQTMKGDYPAARRALERALAISPADDSYHFALGQLHMLDGRPADARVEFQKQTNEATRQMAAAMIEHAIGREKSAQQALKDLIAKHAQDMAYQIADVYAWSGDKEKAFEWLARAYEQHDSGLNGIAYDPLLAGLQTDPRYGALLKKLGLGE